MSSDTSAFITAIATCAQAALLIVAAIIAYRQVQEARRVREEQAQPYVVVSLETDPSSPFLLNLAIRNMGKTVAREVFVTFEPEIVSALDKEASGNRIAEWAALKDGIRTLAPGQSMSTMVDSLLERYAGEASTRLPGKFRATVRYKDDRRSPENYSYEYDLDFDVFFGSHWVGRKSLDDLVKSIDKIRSTVEAWTTDRGIRVYGKNLDDLQAEKLARYEEYRAKRLEEQSRHEEPGNGSGVEAQPAGAANRKAEGAEGPGGEAQPACAADGKTGAGQGAAKEAQSSDAADARAEGTEAPVGETQSPGATDCEAEQG
jgi:archaellum component FlaF (FlaF/FlaG flagellin family)